MADQKEDPEYLLAHTGSELERLHKQHAWIQTCLKGQIVFAPVDLKKEGMKVLDVGCADGQSIFSPYPPQTCLMCWINADIACSGSGYVLRDLQKQLAPTAQLVGADVMPSFLPKQDPSGSIRYVIQDICEPFASDLQAAFDLTLVRFVLAGSARVGIEAAVNHLVSSLKPGGWLQVLEMDVEDMSDCGPAVKDLFFILRSLFTKISMGPNWAPGLEAVFKDAGLENVSVQRIGFPAGKKMGNETDSRNSMEPFKITIPSLISACGNMSADLPASVTDHLPERFEKEMTEQGGTIMNYVVTGQKKSL
jgi:SAM-dependent methyltransferase